MAASGRKKYSFADELALTTQVAGKCPLCGAALFYKKGSKKYKAFELAHIYPLNPSPAEVEELKHEEQLHADVNHPDNLIPLCLSCHGKFDKPRTATEYREFLAIKKAAIRQAQQQEIQASYQLEDDIGRVIHALHTDPVPAQPVDLQYSAKSVAEKLEAAMPLPTQQKIKHNVADYYPYIRTKFLEMERDNPTASELIFSQVKSYYLKQKSLALPQQEIFANIVAWFYARTKPQSIEAAEIVTSFFIQNCEVFE
jgi:hypothetical protein